MEFILDTVLVVLVADFFSGALHWLEDSYGNPDWRIIGALITTPNILHHQRPAAFTKHSWLKSADVLIFLGAVIIVAAWASGMLTWQVLLLVAIGVNGNEIHKWNHLPKNKRSQFVVALQKLRLLQTSEHHAKHHALSKDTNYCVITNVMNPVLDAVQFWRRLEWTIQRLFGVSKRSTT